MKIHIIGKLIAIKEKEKISERFTKQSIWLEVPDGKYLQTLNIEFINNAIDEIYEIEIGNELQVEAYLKGRLWQEKCFTSISGSKITKIAGADESKMVKQGNMTTWDKDNTLADDLPF